MELFTAIDTRVSAARLATPGPTAQQLERILQAGARAPDHGRLRPWRFHVIEGAQRDAFAQAAAAAKRVRLPAITEQQMIQEREKITRSPALIVVGCVVDRTQSKIPEIEQLIATGAAAQNIFLAAHDLGFGVMWKTGVAAYDPAVKAVVGLGHQDHVVAILHLGTRVK